MRDRRPITSAEILAGRDQPEGSASPGGWSKEKLAEWGVPWPAPAFWLRHLIEHGVPYMIVDDGSDGYQPSPFKPK